MSCIDIATPLTALTGSEGELRISNKCSRLRTQFAVIVRLSELGMDPGAQLSLFSAWRHPVMGAGMELSQAAYRYNQNMMEYYTCKNSKSGVLHMGDCGGVLHV